MKHCVTCGHGNPDGSTFCGACGRKIDSPDGTPERGVLADFGHQMGVAFLAVIAIIVTIVFFFWVNSR